MIVVIDASVALKWFMPGETDGAKALAVLRALERNPREFAVPELFFNEMLAVFCRAEGASLEMCGRYLRSLEELGLHRVGNGRELLQTALGMALEWKISGYDAVYAATARLLGGTWLTADEKAARRVRERGTVELLTHWRGP